MTFSEFYPLKRPSREGQWMKMVIISLGLHLLILALFLNIFPQGGGKRILEPAYVVDLVSSAGEGPSGGKTKEPLPSPSPPITRAEPKPISVPKPVVEKKVPPKEDQSKVLEKAMEELKKNVRKEKSLENTLSHLEKRVQEEKTIEKAISRLKKKGREEQSREVAPSRLENIKPPTLSGGTGTGPGGLGSIASSNPGGQDGLGIEFQLYHTNLRSRIKKNWGLPEDLLRRNDISAEIMIRIGRSGRIEDFRFQRKSGVESFDQEVVRTLKKSDPLPPLPAGYPKYNYEVVLTFHSKELSGK
jgi:colicin import membrane protein